MGAPANLLREVLALAASFLAGIVVAAILSPKDIYFGGNFLMFVTPMAIVLGILLAIGSRLAFVTGAGIAFALFLAVYGAWTLPITRGNQFAWLVYVISTPGAGFGAIVGDQIVRARKPEQFMTTAGIGVLATFTGLMINQMLVRILFMG